LTDNIKNHKSIIEKLDSLTDTFVDIVDWFKNINQHIADFSVDLFGKLFELLTFISLQTPTVIFSGEYVNKVVPAFSLISVSIIILLSIYESIMMMIRKKHTKGTDILKRIPIAIGVAGVTPFLFQEGFKMINKLSIGITKITGGVFNENFLREVANVGFVDALGLLAFDIVLIALIIPLIIQNARRWWDLFCLCLISPLALTTYIFDRHKHLFASWLEAIKKKATVQLVYATFISLLGLFIFSTRFISPEQWAIKLLIVLGSLSRLSNPPQIVKSYLRGENLDNDFESVFRRKIPKLNTVSFWMSGYKSQNKLAKKKTDLRKKHGKRFVDDLIK
jgi:hypothetical protein